MQKMLLFINALSARLDDRGYDPLAVQQLIAHRLVLPLNTIQKLWTEIDMTGVKEMSSAKALLGERPTIAESLASLMERAAEKHQCSLSQFHCAVVLPAIGQVAALQKLTIEASRLTGQRLTAVVIMGQEEAGHVLLFHVMPELKLDDEFADALRQTREAGTM